MYYNELRERERENWEREKREIENFDRELGEIKIERKESKGERERD